MHENMIIMLENAMHENNKAKPKNFSKIIKPPKFPKTIENLGLNA